MAKKKKEIKKVDAFGDITNPDIYNELKDEPENKPVKVVEPVIPKVKEKPETWPFHKGNVGNEKYEMQRVSRKINMKYDTPGVKKITKVIVYDCGTKQVECKDYKLDY